MIHRVFFFLLIVFLPTQLGFHFWPEWSYVLGRRIDFLSPTLFLTDIFLLLTCILWCVTWMKSKYPISNHQYPTWKKKKLYFVFSLVFLLCMFIYFNYKNAASWQVSIYSWVKFLEYLLLFFYIIKTKPSMLLLSTGLIIGVLYSSGIAIGQFLFQHSLGGIFWFLGERTFTVDTPGIARFPLCLPSFFGCVEFLRSYATFPHPNVLAGYLAIGIPLLIKKYLKIYSSSVREKFSLRSNDTDFRGFEMSSNQQIYTLNIVRKVAIALGLVALFLTFSRSGILVGVIAFLVSLLFCHSRPASKCGVNFSGNPVNFLGWIPGFCPRMTKRILSFFFFVLCILALIFGSWLVVHSFQPFEESVTVRQELMQSAWTLFQSSPLFGIGLGNFIIRLPDALTVHTVYFLQPVHNIYLLVLSEIGIVGIGLFLFLAFYLLNTEYRIMNTEVNSILQKIKRQRLSTMHYSLLRIELRTGTALFTILILGLVDHYWITLQQGQILLVIVMGYFLVAISNPIFRSRRGGREVLTSFEQ